MGNTLYSVYFQIEALMGDLGGILGLYIGFSVLTILELFELGTDLLVLLCMKMVHSKVQPNPTSGGSGGWNSDGKLSSPPPPYPYKVENSFRE